MCVGVCVCGCGRVCVCVCAGVGVGGRSLACASARVALLIQHETCSHIAISGLSGCTTFLDVTSETARF